MTGTEPIFCCSSATPIALTNTYKLHNDPNREIHDAIFRSFLAFAVRKQRSATLLALIMSHIHEEPAMASPINTLPAAQRATPAPVLTTEALQNNPLTSQTPYVIHLTSRHDFRTRMLTPILRMLD
jgi:hypothetical protein